MTHAELKERFPHASEEFLRANTTDAPRSVRGAVKRITVAHTTVDAGLLHPITESVPGKTLERDAPAEIGSAVSLKQRPKIHFTLYRVALLDPDNKWASVKFLLDAMRYAGLIPNDRECDIEMIVTQQKVAHRAEEGTGVEILYP
ncbi:MAG TPA: hypothetical protein VHS96_13860 [Bacteroidia bacterium]|nr:hypothetical protein [Bacteroidia bacterium]